MENIIEFKNVNFSYDSLNCIKEFNMQIEKKSIVSLIGPSGSGKTMLLKMLCHKLPNDAVFYKGNPISSYSVSELQRNIIVIFDEPIKNATVRDELIRFMVQLNFNRDEMEKRYDEMSKLFDLNRFDEIETSKLNSYDCYLLKIIRYLILQPEFVAIDNILTNVKKTDKDKIFEYIKKYEITLLNVTTDMDETLYGDKICVIEDFVLILEGQTLTVLKTDTLLKRLGFSLPLIIDLSIELNHYDVTKNMFTESEKLVEELWK